MEVRYPMCVFIMWKHIWRKHGTVQKQEQRKAGTTTAINICYRDPGTGKWSIINPDGGFLEMMKHWDPSITLTEISGENLVIKGTRAMIVSSGSSFFIENIDKMVEDYLANPY